MSTRVLFIADSRGRLLYPEISRYFDPLQCDYEFIWRGGLSLEQTADFARSTILNFKPTMVYILTGICSITRITSREPWSVALRIPTVSGTVTQFLIALDKDYQDIFALSSLVGHPIMIVTPTLSGLDFTVYNSYPEDLISPHQRVLNAAILEINRRIVALNRAMSIKTPFLASFVHPRCRHTNRFVYNKLTDGCHPSTTLCRNWALKLWHNFRKNMDYYPTYFLINRMY